MDIPIVRDGQQVPSDAARELTAPVSVKEIDNSLKFINDNKAPGIDGYNSLFFKKVWHVIKPQIYQAIWDFLEGGIMPTDINCTLVTLVLKLPILLL